MQVFSLAQTEQFLEQSVQTPDLANDPKAQVTTQELPYLLNPDTQLVQLFLSPDVQSAQLLSQIEHLFESS